MELTNYGSFIYTKNITVLPYRHYSMNEYWKVSLFKTNRTHENGPFIEWEKSYHVFATDAEDAVTEGIKAYKRNKEKPQTVKNEKFELFAEDSEL